MPQPNPAGAPDWAVAARDMQIRMPWVVIGAGWKWGNMQLHARRVASFARTSLMIDAGTVSSLRPLREGMSRARGWSQRIMPVVWVPAPVSGTVKPAVRAKFPPFVMGRTTGVLVSRLKGRGI